MRNFLYAVSPTDIVTIVSVTVLMLFAAGLASAIPAIRGSKIDPVIALRHE